jgi:hypothetical protein
MKGNGKIHIYIGWDGKKNPLKCCTAATIPS